MTGWSGTQSIDSRAYVCGHCGNQIASSTGWESFELEDRWREPDGRSIYICLHCDMPTYFGLPEGDQIPAVAMNGSIEHLPPDLGALYTEACRCLSAGAPTASLMLCRKMLMNVAVGQGAPEGASFRSYVDHLVDTGHVSPQARQWLEVIRRFGNQATHEIEVAGSADAQTIVRFVELLLRLVYELPEQARQLNGEAPAASSLVSAATRSGDDDIPF